MFMMKLQYMLVLSFIHAPWQVCGTIQAIHAWVYKSSLSLLALTIIWSYGWWFGTFFIFPYIGNSNPNWLKFFRGVETTNQSYDHMITDDMFGVWLWKKRGCSIRQQRTWLVHSLVMLLPSPNTTRPQLCCITAHWWLLARLVLCRYTWFVSCFSYEVWFDDHITVTRYLQMMGSIHDTEDSDRPMWHMARHSVGGRAVQ